jgi:hypothetical protein
VRATAHNPGTLVWRMLTVLALTVSAHAMEVMQQGTKLIVTGGAFRYTWDSRRGGELSVVEQKAFSPDGWWLAGTNPRPQPPWQRVNGTFAFKSLDTIPSLSFSTLRGAYFSGDWKIAYASADRDATIKILKKTADEVVFETSSNPRIVENRRDPLPWKVRQVVRVFDSGVILTDLEISLPKGEVYELDWAQMGMFLDDSLFKEPHPDRQSQFVYGTRIPGEEKAYTNSYMPMIDGQEHLPLDVDIDVEKDKPIITKKPMLYGWAAYDMMHVKGGAMNACAEVALEEARSLTGTKEDFGSRVLSRRQSNLSPTPTEEGSLRPNPCFEVAWNLFDGKTAGLNEPMVYRNRLTMAFGMRKRSNSTASSTDQRNILLGARVYYSNDKLPSESDVKTMAADGCDTLLLGPAWRADRAATTAVIKAAHDSGIRVGATVDIAQVKELAADGKWFTDLFQKDRDGVVLTNADFLADAVPQGDADAMGEKVSFKRDAEYRVNAASFALCMRAIRQTVGSAGFMIGVAPKGAVNLLSLAECDLQITDDTQSFIYDSPANRMSRRIRGAAGFGLLTPSVSENLAAMAAEFADTPILLWPARDGSHKPLWQIFARLGKDVTAGGDLLPGEKAFTTSNPDIHGTLFERPDGTATLLLAAEKPGSATISFFRPGATVTGATMNGNAFDTGTLSAWQVKTFDVTFAKESGK